MKYSNAKWKYSFRLKYTKVLCLKSIFILLISSCGYSNTGTTNLQLNEEISLAGDSIKVGAVNISEYLPDLQGKNIGIVGNQSSMVYNTHLVDTLLSLNVKIGAVFSPEHGFRGNQDAGEHIANETDEKTGLTIVSLYGKNRKPTNEQVKGIEVMLFDIQDVGVRFYTYISTLHYVMEICAENGIPLVVLDRPNPNGHYVDGPVLDLGFKSFVGMHQIPVVHGMTIGEYAQMINGEKWLKGEIQCSLKVVKCENYSHETPYSLPIPPSPNLRSDVSIQLYPSICFFEGSTVSVGRGTDGPFERYGHPDFPKTDFEFTPKPSYGAKSPKLNGMKCYGYNLNDSIYGRLYQLDLSFLINANKSLVGKEFINRTKFFNLLAGNDILIEQIKSGMPEEEIRNSWKEGLDKFKITRAKYLLYN